MTLQQIEARTLDALRTPRERLTAMQLIADELRALLDGGRFRFLDVHNGQTESFAPACRQILLGRAPPAVKGAGESMHRWLDSEPPKILVRPIRDVTASAGKTFVGNPYTDGAKAAIPADSWTEKRFVTYRAGKTYAVPLTVAIHLEPRLVGCTRAARMLAGKGAQRALSWLSGNAGPAVLVVGYEWQGRRYETATAEEIQTAATWAEWTAKYLAAPSSTEQTDLAFAFVRAHGNRAHLPADAPGEIGDAPTDSDAPEPVQPRRGKVAA